MYTMKYSTAMKRTQCAVSKRFSRHGLSENFRLKNGMNLCIKYVMQIYIHINHVWSHINQVIESNLLKDYWVVHVHIG